MNISDSRMTNREWAELIAKEFKVSNTVAKKMLSAMYTARRICKLDESFDKERKPIEQLPKHIQSK